MKSAYGRIATFFTVVVFVVSAITCKKEMEVVPEELRGAAVATSQTMEETGEFSSENPRVFFLPPLSPKPSFAGEFDPSLSPVVQICELTGSVCKQPAVATFSMTSGKGSEVVRMDASEQHYMVNWSTKNANLVVGKVYRILIKVESGILAFTDVMLAANGASFQDARTGAIIPVKEGRTLPIKFRIEKGALENLVALPDGGKMAFPNGVKFDIPSGALSSPTIIQISGLTHDYEPLLRKRMLSQREWRIMGGFSAKPDGLKFKLPVEVTIPVRAGFTVDEVPVLMEVSGDGESIRIADFELYYYRAKNEVNMKLSHFSEYPLGGIDVEPSSIAENHPCRSLVIKVTSSDNEASSSAIGGGCTIVTNFVRVDYLSCPQPVTESVQESSASSQCGDEGKLVLTLDKYGLNTTTCIEKGPVIANVAFQSETITSPVNIDWPLSFWVSEGAENIAVRQEENKFFVKGLKSGASKLNIALFLEIAKKNAIDSVAVNIENPSVVLDKSTIEINSGEESTLKATVRDGDGNIVDNALITWRTSRPDCIDLVSDQTGVVEFAGIVPPGETVVNASITASFCGTSATANIKVVKRDDFRILLSSGGATFFLNSRQVTYGVLQATVYSGPHPNYWVPDAKVEWRLDNPGVCWLIQFESTPNNVHVQANSPGTCKVTASYMGVEASATYYIPNPKGWQMYVDAFKTNITSTSISYTATVSCYDYCEAPIVSPVVEKGFFYGFYRYDWSYEFVELSRTNAGPGPGTFSLNMNGLSPNTRYGIGWYYRTQDGKYHSQGPYEVRTLME